MSLANAILYRITLCMRAYIKNSLLILTFILLLLTRVVAQETHTLQQGETVYQLSNIYGIPVEILLDINNIEDPTDIPTGQTLQVSRQSSRVVDTTQYTIKKGDTLYSIAHKNNISLKELLAFNKNLNENIKIGQVINIPTLGKVLDIDSNSNNAVVQNKQPKTTNKEIVSLSNNSNEYASSNIKRSSYNNFANLSSQELLGSAESVGIVSEKWPVSGKGYILNGKLPGVLIEGTEDQIVHARTDGVVLYAALHTSFSNVVVIQGTDGIVYVYAGQKNLFVKQGDIITKGSQIGLLGIMPTLQKPVLYFSLWQNNKFLDPRKVIIG